MSVYLPKQYVESKIAQVGCVLAEMRHNDSIECASGFKTLTQTELKIMNTFEIFADSSANLPDGLIEKHNINIISYTCIVNGEERLCYVPNGDFTQTAKKFYEDLRNGADVKTSLIDEQRIIEAVTPAMQSGRDAVFITISAGISGTYNQAIEAKKTLEKQFPRCKLYVCDSANASLGEGLLVLKAADLRDMGESAEACAKWINTNAYKLNSYLTVGDLKFLKKGGRISAAAAIAGTILNIKPLIRADGGSPAKLAFYAKERGRKKALTAILEACKTRAVNIENQTVAIAHADCEEDALYLAEAIKTQYGVKDVIIEYYDLCTGSHAGPGTVALFFMGKDRKTETLSAQTAVAGKTAVQKN